MLHNIEKYNEITVFDAVMVSAEDTLPEEDCWLLAEKYANKLPIVNDIEKCYYPPPYEPPEYPMQWQKHKREPLNIQIGNFCRSAGHKYASTKRELGSKKAKITYKYILLAALTIYTIYFCIWTFKYHNK
ncbi:ZYRO0C06292p [Zygosaccharomyces rouxii]|uniref:ZYRO0C06292p n=1 Tax=Zygosaccharomyces rouxii (strain ATCC 2623 / CBS 732 / NBRC 1130 / NCYC 568 / NRRL Y-229) TaxID=559307 RepID=C5DT81_ZYGRC|nr:uncharacterized protein ZYRO0C06292g [Zygosaccharomyces rouxii]CAR26992.1 ZYRO0C06292p [Zygosaccharomyces rouxii]